MTGRELLDDRELHLQFTEARSGVMQDDIYTVAFFKLAADAIWFGDYIVEASFTFFSYGSGQLFASGEKLVCRDVTITVRIEENDLLRLTNGKGDDCLESAGLEANGGDAQANIMRAS